MTNKKNFPTKKSIFFEIRTLVMHLLLQKKKINDDL